MIPLRRLLVGYLEVCAIAALVVGWNVADGAVHLLIGRAVLAGVLTAWVWASWRLVQAWAEWHVRRAAAPRRPGSGP